MKHSIKEHLAIFGCSLGLYISNYLINRFIETIIQRQTAIIYAIVLLIIISFTVVTLVLYIKWAGLDTFRFKGIGYKIWLWTFLLCVSQWLFFCTLGGYPIWIENYHISKEITDYNYTIHIIYSFNGIFCISVINAIIYRGLLQKQLSNFFAPWLSISIITILIILLNLQKPVFLMPQALISAIFVGIVYYKTGKIILCILYSSLFQLIWNTTRYSFDRSFSWLFLILAITFTVFAIRGFMKEKVENKSC